MKSSPLSRAVLALNSSPEIQVHILAPGPIELAVPDCLICEVGDPQSTGLVWHRMRPGLPSECLGRTVRSRSDNRLTANANLFHIPEVISWLVTCSAWHLRDTQRLRVRGALHELLLNALEHGTLELGFRAKRQALAEGRYEELLMQRLTEPRLKNRHVAIQVRYERHAKCLTYRIADEGKGFRWRSVLKRLQRGGKSAAVSGRGIFLARSLFPSLTYNDRGNEATMTVPLA